MMENQPACLLATTSPPCHVGADLLVIIQDFNPSFERYGQEKNESITNTRWQRTDNDPYHSVSHHDRWTCSFSDIVKQPGNQQIV